MRGSIGGHGGRARYHDSLPWQLRLEQDLDVAFQVPVTVRLLYVPPNFTLSTPFTWSVLSMTAFDEFTTALWQTKQPMLECFEWRPVDGGLPWHEVHDTCVVLVQLTVAPLPLFTPPENLPWQ